MDYGYKSDNSSWICLKTSCFIGLGNCPRGTWKQVYCDVLGCTGRFLRIHLLFHESFVFFWAASGLFFNVLMSKKPYSLCCVGLYALTTFLSACFFSYRKRLLKYYFGFAYFFFSFLICTVWNDAITYIWMQNCYFLMD